MTELKVCRICLRTEIKIYHYDRFQLKFYYEEVMASKVNADDDLPQFFCYECAMVLHKFHKFKEKCYSGQKVLRGLLWKGPITYESIKKVDLNDAFLMSSLSLNHLHNNILVIKYEEIHKQLEIENVEVDLTENKPIEKMEPEDVDYFSEQSMSDREEQDPINETILGETMIVVDKNELNNVKVKEDNDDFDDDDKNDPEYEPTNELADEGVRMKLRSKKKNKLKDDGYHMKADALSNGNWKKITMSEEEAVKEFREKAESKKYLAAAFKCTDCYRGFSKKNMLDRHVQLRHVETLGQYECSFCHMRYRLGCLLRRHMRRHYDKYQCLRCGLQCDLEQTAILHEEYHSGVVRKCTYCNEEFKHMSTYYSHLRTHRSQHVCTLCGVSFVSTAGLKQHKRVKHIIADVESPDDDEEVNTYCQRCDIRFETRKAYEEHMFHSALHCEDVESKQAEEPVEPRGAQEKVGPTRKVLGKKEKMKITKELSKKRNDDEPIMKCGRKSFKRNNRRTHRKPTDCHQCGEHFDTQAACMKHHLEKHPRTSFFSPNERYICEICGSSLAPGSIANHQNMHTRETVHTCDTCGRQFHAAISLKRHLVVSIRQLVFQPGSLATHMNAHSREVTHACHTCGRTFTETASLKRHYRTHTGEKPYACTLCDKRFTQSNSMKLHYRTYHLKQPYPKRNRWKKKDDPKSKHPGSTTEDESGDSIPAHAQNKPDDNMHFLTLT